MNRQEMASSFLINDVVSVRTKKGHLATGYLKTLDFDKNSVVLQTGAASAGAGAGKEGYVSLFECTVDDVEEMKLIDRRFAM